VRNEEGRPASRPSAKFTAAQQIASGVDPTASRDNSAARRIVPLPLSWARQLIANGGKAFPEYGSREWVSLDDRDPRKVAACVEAAERWRTRNYAADVYALPTGRRAREIAEARRPRPGDYMGGPVKWDGVGANG
jgi:hypothetical protein